MFEDGAGWQAQSLQMMLIMEVEQLTAKETKRLCSQRKTDS
jgi:hypothetical protein